MDAKPQRPFRTLRVRGDENILPLNNAGKSLHQRNKSTPALSTLAGPGGVKNAVKRTAFGDLSNTVNNTTRATKDDASLAAKGVVITEKPAALSRPAQRPLAAAAGVRAALTNVHTSNTNVIDAGSKQSALDKLPANPRKALVKRSNTVYKDTSLPSVVESEPIGGQSHQATSANNPETVNHAAEASAASVNKISATVNAKPMNLIPTNDSVKTHLNSAISISSDEPAALRSDGAYIEENGEVKRYNENGDKMHERSRHSSKQKVSITKETVAVKTVEAGVASTENPAQARVRYDQVHLPSEPEEYWDEEDEDNYEEDGYVTARSQRSRGDNTTGGATVLLLPKVTQKVKRELAIAKQVVEATRTPEEIESECWDTSMVAEYGDEIFQYMRDLELKMLPNAHYMDNQAEIQWSMRSVLMDWLVQVHHRFSLLPETLFLCVNYIDRFLSCKIVSLGKLQLVGATAIFIAAKYEEINCPSLQEIIYMVDNGYSADEILKAERFMLSMLQFELGWPGPMSFLRRISKADDYDLETRTLAKYFLEITIMDERFVGSPPSFTAAGAHCLARLMLQKGSWTPAHVHYSNYTYSQLHPLVSLILECCESPQKHHAAVYEKYSDRRFKRASYFVESEMNKGFKLPETAREGSTAHLINLFDNPSHKRQ
ncbi:hypothetical protein FQN52_004412 [Onygenales sp. PD_12]|nr:hypothetical protein FQN52_004412 [Onygenales sp. PD_12]